MLGLGLPVYQEDVDRRLLEDRHHNGNKAESENKAKDCIEGDVTRGPFVNWGQEDEGALRHFESDEPVGSNEEEDPEHDPRPYVEEQVN